VNLGTLDPLIPHISTFGWQGSLAKLTYSALATFSSALGTRHPVLSASGGIKDAQGVITSMASVPPRYSSRRPFWTRGPRS